MIKITTLSALLLSAMHASAFNDENAVERILVTADLTQKDLSQLPASALVLNDELIEFRESRHLEDMIAAMPNVTFSSGATRGKFIQIRGIGERSQFSEPTNPSVGLLLDDLDISGLGSLATVFDLQQIELLSGPQSIASGVNSLAGVIKLVSNNSDAENQITFSAAEFGEWQAGIAAGTDITENLSVRASLQNTQSDGYITNQFLDRDDTNGVNELTGSLFIDFQLDPDSSLSAKFYHFDIDNGYDAFSLDNNNVTLSDEPGFDKTDADALSVKYSTRFGDMLFQTTVSQLQGDFDYAYDEDWTFTGFHPFGYTSFDRYLRSIDRTNLSAKLGSDTNVANDWLIGLSFSKNDESLLRQYTFNAGDFTSQYDPTTYALFGQTDFALTDSVTLTAAARIERFDADYNDSDGFVESIDDVLVAGSLSIQYQLGDNLFYSSISRGYKAGGFNIDQRLSGDNRTFSPEYNWNLEAGVKGQTLDGLASVGVSVFYMRRRDAQVSDFATFEQTLDDGSVITSFADAIRNTDTGTNQGVEVNSTWYITDIWTVTANAGYLDATFGNYTRLDGSFVPEQDQAQAPEFSLYLSSSYAITEDLEWFIDADATDDYRFSDGHNERSPFTLVVNSNVKYQFGANTVSFWIKNAFDRKVYTRGFGGFSNDPRDEYAFAEPYYQFGQERQVGATYTYQF